MKKRLLLVLSLIAVFVCLFAISTFAAEIGGVYYTLNGGENPTATVNNENATNCTLENVVIPKTVTYEGVTYTVTAIADHAFSGNQGAWGKNQTIKTLTIADTVTSVGAHFLRECTSIEKVVINGAISAFYNGAFYKCSNLKEVVLNDTSKFTKVDGNVFTYCGSLQTFVIPQTVTYLGDSCFDGCASLTGDVVLPNLTTFGSSAFNGCKSLNSATIGGTFTSVPSKAFYGANAIKLIDLSGATSLTGSIGGNAFRDCYNATRIVVPNGPTAIGTHAYNNCQALTELVIPNTVVTISDSVFKGIADTTIEIPDSVTSIGNYSFQSIPITSLKLSKNLVSLGCNNFQGSKIKEVIIPASLTSIGNHVFHGSTLEKVIFAATSVPTYDSRAFEGAGNIKIVFFAGVDANSASFFQADNNLKNFSNIISYETYLAEIAADPNKTYSKTIVYGTKDYSCNNCYDLYDNNNEQVVFKDYLSAFSKGKYCDNCKQVVASVKSDAMFTFVGFSIPENGDAGFVVKYTVNNEAIALYKELTGKDVAFGLYAATETKLNGGDIFDEEGMPNEGALKAEVGSGFMILELKVAGFTTEEQKAEKLALGVYVETTFEETKEYSFLNQEIPAEGDKYFFVSYNDVLDLVK